MSLFERVSLAPSCGPLAVMLLLVSSCGGHDGKASPQAPELQSEATGPADKADGVEAPDNASSETCIASSGVASSEATGSRLCVAGSHAYRAAWDSGLLVIDVSDPSRPTQVGSWVGPAGSGKASAVHVQGSLAYVGYKYAYDPQEGSMRIIDVSIPSEPRPLGEVRLGLGETADILVRDELAFIAHGSRGLVVVDVSESTSPTEVGRLILGRTANANRLAWAEDHLVVSTAFQNYLPGGGASGGLDIVDVSDPAAPTRVGSYDAGAPTSAVTVSDGHAYAIVGEQNIIVVDVSSPARPALQATIELSEYASDLAFGGGLLYAASNLFGVDPPRRGLQAISVADPTAPQLLGPFTSIAPTLYSADAVRVDGRYAYVVASRGGLEVFDLSCD